jgi:hypothetical protein
MQQSVTRPLGINDFVLKPHERNARLDGEMRKPDVAVAMDELDQAIGNLFDTTQMLLDRLSPIIRQEPQKEGCCDDGPVSSECAMADHIRRVVGRVRSLTRLVNNHLSALEI